MFYINFKVSHETYFDFEDAVDICDGKIEYENDRGIDRWIDGRVIFKHEDEARKFVDNNASIFLSISKYWKGGEK